MKHRNIVYVIGAGASKDFGLPLGNEIYDYAYKIAALNNGPIHGKLRAAIDEVEKSLRLIFVSLPEDKISFPPFEEVLTFIWDTKRTERFDYQTNKLKSLFNTSRGAEEVLSHYIQMLVLTIAGSTLYYLPRRKIDLYKQYIESIDFKNNDVSFISLNYDLILDNLLKDCVAERIIKDYTYAAPLLADASIRLAYHNQNREVLRDGGIFLLKPHGSINLVYCSDHKQATYGEGYFCITDDLKIVNGDGIPCASCGHKTKRLIIPPLYNKRDFVDNTKPKSQRLIWRSTPEDYRLHVDRRIKEVLAKADEIIVIGYSMPAYDYDFKSLLITSLMSNKKRKDVHLKIITKGNKSQLEALKAQYRYLIGSVTIEGANGFYNYLKTREWTRNGRRVS
jgi:NAD-dependent SIR2 family protein deacetylase